MNVVTAKTLGFALAVSLSIGGEAVAETDMQEHRIQSSTDSGIELYVRERLPAGQQPAEIDRAVLFVHGATYPGITFDLDLEDGKSWMDRTAEAGYATYYVDIRGYGNSTRPEVMEQPAEDNEPFARGNQAVNDIADAVDFIVERTGAEQIDLVGWSWGTVTTGMYTADHNDQVRRLVLFAPVYNYDNKGWTSGLAAPDKPYQLAEVGAYRTVNREQADERWAKQITADSPQAWRSQDVYDRWFDAMLAMEPAEDAKVVKAPNGTLVDIWNIFNERPVYDASEITVPTLIIRGAADITSTDADAQGLFRALGSETKRYIVIGEGTHFVNLEKNAPQVFAETLLFVNGVNN